MVTVCYLLNVPTDIPSDNVYTGWEVVFQKLPKKSKEIVLLSLGIRKFGDY